MLNQSITLIIAI